MNKSIILSAMLALSMPALAADVLYVNGFGSQTINGKPSPGWTVTAPLAVQPTDGKFIVEVKNFRGISVSTQLGTNQDDWVSWNQGEHRIVGWVNGIKVEETPGQDSYDFPGKFVGCTTALEINGNSMEAADAGMAGDYTFVFDQELTKCQILPHALYLCGSTKGKIFGVDAKWDIKNPVKVSKVDGVFKFNVTIPGGTDTQFDVSTTTPLSGCNDWNFYNLGMFSATINQATLGTAVDLAHASTGFIFAEDVPAGDYTVTITEDMSKVTVTDKAVPAVTTLYVNGAVGENGAPNQIVNGTTITSGWSITDPVAVPLVDGKFTIKVDNFLGVGFSTQKGTNQADWNAEWNPNAVGLVNTSDFGIAKVMTAATGYTSNTLSGDHMYGTKGGSYTIIIPEDLSTITVLPNQLYLAGDAKSIVDGTNLGGWDIVNPRKIELDEENGVFAFTYYTKANYNIDLSVLWANSGSADWTTWGNGKFSTDGSTYTAENVNTRQSLINNKTSQMVTKEGTYNVAVARDMSYVILCENTEGTIDTGTNNYYATFSNPYSDIELGGNGIEVYNVTVSGDQLVLTKRSDNKVAKGEGVLVKVSSDATITVKPIDAGLTAASEAENYLVPTPVTAGTVSESGFKLYRLAYDNYTAKTGLGFYLGNADGSITYTTAKPYKAYLKVSTAQSAQIKKFLLNPQPTHVDGINVNEQETDKAIYDISGRRVENPTPGFYIQGNKKIVIR